MLHRSFIVVFSHISRRVLATGTVVAHTLIAAVPRMIKMQPVEHSVPDVLVLGARA
jgi:hypothetical protein